MENIPNDIHDNISGNSTYDMNPNDLTYVNDNNFSQISWNNTIISCQKIENLNSLHNFDNVVQEIINIHKEITYDNDYEFKKDYQGDEEVNKHEIMINNFSDNYKTISQEFQKHQQLTLISETKYKTNYDKLQSDIGKVTDFKEFALSINSRYENLETNKLNESILEIIKKINDDNDNNPLKEDFVKQNYIFNLYLYKFIKEINSCNNGSTCSICLMNKVDTFMEPCGHTGCSECIEKLKERSGGEYNCNCFLCRKNVIKFHKLYFT